MLLSVVVTGALPARAKAIDAGEWVQAPHLLEEHVAHTATLLDDGRVLIAGGTDVHGIARASSELFDPESSRWIRAAAMINARAGHAATLLENGNVLITGGVTGLGIFPVRALASAEIYHPSSNSWTAAAAMHVPRRMHSSIRLYDGRVLVIGGTNEAPGSPLPAAQQEQAEVYDPRLDSWSLAGMGLPELSSQAATLMPDGTVLVTGGTTDTGFATVSAELFDPATTRWQPTTWPMATPRYGHTATLLTDGRVLLVGGYSTQPEISAGRGYPNGELLTTSEIFDLRGNIGVRMGYSGIPRLDHTATLLGTGKVLIVGSAYASDADSQIFDPKNTEHWASTGMPMDRYLHTATVLTDGRVLVAGGFGVGSPATAWIFSATTRISASSAYPSVVLAAGVLLMVLIGIAFAATSRRRARRPTTIQREDASKWIDP